MNKQYILSFFYIAYAVSILPASHQDTETKASISQETIDYYISAFPQDPTLEHAIYRFMIHNPDLRAICQGDPEKTLSALPHEIFEQMKSIALTIPKNIAQSLYWDTHKSNIKPDNYFIFHDTRQTAEGLCLALRRNAKTIQRNISIAKWMHKTLAIANAAFFMGVGGALALWFHADQDDSWTLFNTLCATTISEYITLWNLSIRYNAIIKEYTDTGGYIDSTEDRNNKNNFLVLDHAATIQARKTWFLSTSKGGQAHTAKSYLRAHDYKKHLPEL